MIRNLIAKLRRHYRAMCLRADIALIDQARYELYLCTRKSGTAVTN